MTRGMRINLLRSVALVGVIAVGGCGGGAGMGSTPAPTPAPSPAPSPTPTPTPAPTPTPTPSPTPTPTPTPTPAPTPAPTPTPTPTPTSSYDTAEYRATVGAVSANSLAAYSKGATGLGIKVGIVDSGIDLQSAEFGTRIDPASADVAGDTSIDDEGGHGTAVAFTIGGRRNDAGTHGISFDATLIVARADTPGSCATTKDNGDSGCSFNDSAIARGIDLAVTNGARVINISLGGSAAGAPVINAINRATAAGVIVVIAAGNDGTADPDPFAQVANNAVSRGLVIIAGSVGPNDSRTPGADVISSFSDKAGNSIVHYLAAVGEKVRAPDNNNTPYLWSGTSFAAPQIAGAVALLAQAFPNLTGAQIVSILFQSARDAGDVGPDAVYGQGVLDLTKAFAPIGATSIAGTPARVSLGLNGTLSAPMGDARQGALNSVILDSFQRAYTLDLASTIIHGSPQLTLVGALQARVRNYSSDLGNTSVALTVAPTRGGALVQRTMLSSAQAERARAIAGIVTQRLGSTASFAIGFAESGATLSARLAGRADPAFLVAQDPTHQLGFDSQVRGAMAVRQTLGKWGVTVSTENGAALSRDAEAMAAVRDHYLRFGYLKAGLAIDRRFGRLTTALSGTRLMESGTLLGARFGDGLGGTRATSWFVDVAARIELGARWSLGGSLRRGWTFADLRSGVDGRGTIHTDAYSADIAKDGLFDARDSFGLRIAQPLRVTRGGIALRLPTDYDYGTGAVTAWTTQTLNLAPTGHEIDVEGRYALPFLWGDLQTNMFYRRDPGNFAALPDDVGATLRWSAAF